MFLDGMLLQPLINEPMVLSCEPMIELIGHNTPAEARSLLLDGCVERVLNDCKCARHN